MYDFMDTNLLGVLTAAYIFGIGGMGVVTFFVVQGVVWLKSYVCGGRHVWRAEDDLSGWELGSRVEESIYGEKPYPKPRQGW